VTSGKEVVNTKGEKGEVDSKQLRVGGKGGKIPLLFSYDFIGIFDFTKGRRQYP
jgi:hypothetical protein